MHGRPRKRLDKLNDALGKALDDPNTRKRLLELGSEIPEGGVRTSQALAELVENEVARWTPVFQTAGVAAN